MRKMDINLRCDAINHMVNKHNIKNITYLEIGVYYGETIRGVRNAVIKDGVDVVKMCNNVNYVTTSDDFFANHANKAYDVIFVDGLHTAAQVTRDVMNSLLLLKDGGLLFIDDVYPHTEVEQLPLDLSNTGPNTGDVWKAIFDIFELLESNSDDIIFFKDIDRGMLGFKIRDTMLCHSNIKVDDTIPQDIREWTKYSYTKDFHKFLEKIMPYFN